ncbi:hypothetical protein [Methylobacter sp. YRD-M1]|uniref:hypothetical protein n=1 Tax=Methylobacter sp. YRD-M1 TaxID=2911520 RepID=UPI00227B0758|nr:hypothetical protein [Methylobacter sp. YRD-M1]WAK03176.1 hypothetical protein LZ558_05160 [Methylobacter sp. YRD-M1]
MTLKNILPFGKSSQLLVCETDGFSLHGAVLARSGSRIVLLHQAKTEQVDMAEALTDVVSALKADGWKGGGSAVLLTPAVLSALAELPVNPKKPRPVAQMMELVRWEAEPLLMQHMARWTVGQLLAGRGYMTEEQVQAVMDLQQGKPNPAGGLALSDKFSSRRFGDLAEELGYIKRSQLNACLAAQTWLKADDELIECNWTSQGAVEDIPGTFHWLVSCVGQSLLQRWTEVFNRQGVKLMSMYPSAGCGANLLPKSQTAGLILETHPRQVWATRLNAGKIAAHHQYLSLTQSPLEICLESYHALQAAPNEPLWLAGGHDAPLLAADLRQMLAVEVNELDDPAVGEVVTPGMAGAAHHALGISGEGRCVGVREGGPLPPLPQRLEVRAAALAALLLVSVAAAEISLMVRKDAVEAHKQEVDARWKSIDEATKRIKAQTEQIEQRKKTLAQQKADQARLEAMLNFYSHAIPEREELVRGVLGVLQETVTDEVIIVSIDETAKSAKAMPVASAMPAVVKDKRVEVESFNIEAWAVSEAAAQAFIQKMKEKVAPWHLEVRDAQVSSRTGPLNLDGFAVLMRLVRLIEGDSAAPVQQKADSK